jgi:hypothetical protein
LSKLICNNYSKHWGRIKPSLLLWLVGILLGLAVLCYLMRNAILKWTIEYYATEQQVQVSCLEVEFNWQFDVTFSHLCLKAPNFTVHLQDASWLRNSNQVIIQNAQVKHQFQAQTEEKQTTSTATNFAQLPKNLPTIRIEHLSVESPFLTDNLQLSVELQNTRQLMLAGDINAALLLDNNTLSAQVDWLVSDVVHFYPAAAQFVEQYPDLLNEDMLKAAKIASKISFDGQLIQSEHLIDFEQDLILPDCHLGLALHGNISANIIDIAKAQTIAANFSSLLIELDLTKCKRRPQFMADWQADKFTVNLPQLIQLGLNKMTVPELQLKQVNHVAAQQTSLTLNLTSLNYIYSQQLHTDYQFETTQNFSPNPMLSGKFNFSSRGKLSATLANSGALIDGEWLVKADDNRLVVDKFGFEKFTVKKGELDFSLKADNNSGLVLNGDLLLKYVQQNTLNIDEARNKISLTVNPLFQFELGLDTTISHIQDELVKIANIVTKVGLSGTFAATSNADLLSKFSAINFTSSSEVNQLQTPSVTVDKISSQFSLQGPQINKLSFNLTHQSKTLDLAQTRLSKLGGTMAGTLVDLSQLAVNGQTNVSPFNVNISDKKVKFESFLIKHSGNSHFTLQNTQSEHDIILNQQSVAIISQQSHDLKLDISIQKINEIQKLISQLMPELTLTQGRIDGNINARISQGDSGFTANGQLEVVGVNGHYDNTLFSGLTLTAPFEFDSAGLQLGNTTLHLDSLNAGIPIEQIEGNLVSESSALKLKRAQGNILGGQFILQDLWLDQRQQMFNLVLQDLDLNKIVALQNQPGIQVTGKIMGSIPIQTQANSVNVDDGKLISQNGGKLSIMHNPAFDTIKQQQTELSFLENYQFSQLSSKVTFKPDGWLYLDLALIGQNPQKKQAVNFNYTHEENMFDLLRTLRVATGIQDKIEKNITQGGKQ